MNAYIPIDVGPNWWRNIPGYNGKYRVNKNGNVQRVFKSGLVRDMTPYRKKSSNFRNRLFVKLTVNGKSKDVAILKIMAETWYRNKDKSLVPYHKNGILSDNHMKNIGFISKKELGKITGYMAGSRRCVLKVNKDGNEVEVYRSAREAAKQNNMSYQTVLDRCHGKVKNPFELDGYTYQFEK